MRLIDADALITLLKKCQQLDWNNNIAPVSWNHAFDNFKYMIDDEPTIEAEPVKRGRWTAIYCPFDTCSECGTSFDTTMGNFNYCPNCGVKMILNDENNID